MTQNKKSQEQQLTYYCNYPEQIEHTTVSKLEQQDCNKTVTRRDFLFVTHDMYKAMLGNPGPAAICAMFVVSMPVRGHARLDVFGGGWANNIRLLFYTYVMPSCYATVRSLELSHIGHPTLLCFFLLFYTYVIRYATLHFHTSKQANKQPTNQSTKQTNKQTRHVPLEKKQKQSTSLQ